MTRAAAERLAGVRCVLFDLDGTLIDSGTLILTSFRYATATVLGEPLPDEVLLENVGWPLRRQMEDFAPEHADELLRVYREHNAEHHDALVAEYPGTEETLVALRDAGFVLGVVTSKIRRVMLQGTDRFGLTRYFGTLVAADETETHKPGPEPLLLAAGRLGMRPEECAYVGDSPHDMSAARAAGMLAVAALWGFFERDRVLEPGADFALDGIGDLPQLLRGDHQRFQVADEGYRSH